MDKAAHMDVGMNGLRGPSTGTTVWSAYKTLHSWWLQPRFTRLIRSYIMSSGTLGKLRETSRIVVFREGMRIVIAACRSSQSVFFLSVSFPKF